MPAPIYTAHAAVTGGRAEGHGVSSDGVLDVQLRLPSEMGGDGSGTNPEQLFAVGFAACFEGALGVVARRERAELGACRSSRASVCRRTRPPRALTWACRWT